MMEQAWLRCFLLYTLTRIGECFSLRDTDDSTTTDEDTSPSNDCNEADYTNPETQKENDFTNCPNNDYYALLVLCGFIAGLVVSYIVLKLIIQCSQIGAPKKKPAAKKKEEKKPAPPKSNPGANGGVVNIVT